MIILGEAPWPSPVCRGLLHSTRPCRGRHSSQGFQLSVRQITKWSEEQTRSSPELHIAKKTAWTWNKHHRSQGQERMRGWLL